MKTTLTIAAFAAAVLAISNTTFAADQLHADTFDGGSNSGAWTWGPPPNIQASGGNPGAYLRGTMDTIAPSLRTTSAVSPFTGNYRSTWVTSLGVDLKTFATQFPFQRECTLVLWSGSCAVYRLGTDFVPQVAEGWKSFAIAVPSQSTTMPAGWAVHPSSSCAAPNPTWNQVIQNVTKVEYFYGDPTFFFIFDIWSVGADNTRVVRELDWTNLGNGKTGTNGVPSLSGSGHLLAGSTVTISLANAKASSPAFLLTGLAQANVPFLGGVLVPDVATTNLVLPLTTSASGTIDLVTPWPAGVPTGTNIVLQYWVSDPAGLFGSSASNGLLGVAH